MISGTGATRTTAAALPAAPGLQELEDTLDRLAGHDGSGLGEAELVDQLRAMEQLKSGLAAAQARLTSTLAAQRSAADATRGVPADQRCRGLGHEVGLARQESPVRGRQHLGLALVLVHELPHTLAALTRGEITEWRATLVARETAVLSRTHRLAVDAELAGTLTTAGDRQVAALARKIGYRLDPGSAIRRVRGAHTDRRVGIRPAPNTMTYLTGFLPVAHGVACHTALRKEADRLRSQGDPRTRAQIMADTLVARITGQTTADAVPVEVNLVMTDHTLLAGNQQPAHLHGYGPLPAALARDLVRHADQAWVRRLFTRPTDRSLVAMDSHRRLFDGQLRRFLILRDQSCRNPWCDAPLRHLDHITRAADGGPTSGENAQGLCEACNHAKEAPGWHTRRVHGPDHVVETTTPTGHRHQSRAPDRPARTGYPLHLDLVFARAA
jgi:5-methylcytosine-specific restriction endonuclease McrA